ncbi:hypothetical protein [Haloplasma contractile]|uniref:DUF4037 domain-containing protein n=1 Tax=Haloplasma contractile SSD-17B TaxID=1033810 RepID=U2FEL0_9MOLU|nr:hypothetical protein [Haloplasma contractile]ERJ11385.1 hypothetical protein HLPCO_002507 [Haloplasma contractile SSD-17B]
MTKRPYVKLKSDNKFNEMYQKVRKNLDYFTSLTGVVGITLNGGLSREYSDHLSEVDLTIYLNPKTYMTWNNGFSPITLGITMIKETLYDLKIIDIEAEENRVWNDIDQWDGSYAKIIYDPELRLKELYNDKQKNKNNINQIENLLFSCWWYYRLAGDIWIHRADVLQGHMIFNKAIEVLIKAVFIANEEFIPHEKWLIHMSRTLNWKPKNWEECLNKAMSTGDLSINSLKDRQEIISELWYEVDEYTREQFFKELPIPMMYKYFYELLKDLIKYERVSIDEWKKKSSLSMLNNDPFHKIVSIQDDTIVLDKEKLLSLRPDDMYSWYYKVVEVVVDGLEINH